MVADKSPPTNTSSSQLPSRPWWGSSHQGSRLHRAFQLLLEPWLQWLIITTYDICQDHTRIIKVNPEALSEINRSVIRSSSESTHDLIHLITTNGYDAWSSNHHDWPKQVSISPPFSLRSTCRLFESSSTVKCHILIKHIHLAQNTSVTWQMPSLYFTLNSYL